MFFSSQVFLAVYETRMKPKPFQMSYCQFKTKNKMKNPIKLDMGSSLITAAVLFAICHETVKLILSMMKIRQEDQQGGTMLPTEIPGKVLYKYFCAAAVDIALMLMDYRLVIYILRSN